MSLYWKMHTTFPFTRVFVLGIILFFLGLASMIISVIAFVTQSWGHYVGTGMWGGAMILASGLTAIFVSRLKSLASVKTLLICSVTAMFTSLTMLILSAGGLTLSSGFYSRIDPTEYNKRTSNLIHASLLVISVFCLSGNVLAVIVCSKYLFFENHDKPKHRRRHRHLADGSVRTSTALRGGAANTSSLRSTNSRTPLQCNDQSRRHSDNLDVNRVQIEYRRSHRRSASDQPHGNSHTRRQRLSHQDGSHSCSNNNSNILSTCGIRYHPDRRSANNRGHNQGLEVRGDSKERDRLNIVPHRQGSNRPCPHGAMQSHLGRSPASASPKIRLPTEFNEEELPPYEAVESSRPQNALNGPGSDSGDESDTENSSSTDAHSYNAEDLLCGEGAEAVPMVDLRHSHRSRNRPVEESASVQHQAVNFALSSHENRSPHRNNPRENQSERLIHAASGTNDMSRSRMNEVKCTIGAGAMVVRKDSNRSNRPLLSYVNTQPSDHLGDYECLLSVSPEVCAITGESPEPVQGAEGHVPHLVKENFYENGPCYENIRCSDKQLDENTANPLSRSSVPNTTKVCTNTTYQDQSRDSSPKLSNPAKIVPVQVLSQSSPVSNSSPQSPHSSFGSTLSAFRPVGATALSPHSICSPTAQSPLSPRLLEDDDSPHENGFARSQHHHSSSVQNSGNEASNINKQYIDQGAIPKAAKLTETGSNAKESTNLSWKNIPLPLSYNHSESASNELEKKLPSKTIPFADSKGNRSSKISKNGAADHKSENAHLSLRVYPLQNPSSSSVPSSSLPTASKSSALPVSPFGAAAEAILSPSTKSNSSMSSESVASHEPPSLQTGNTMSSSVREASTQATSSGSSTRRQFHRMGGNQSLLQSRREELQNSHLSRRSWEMSTRATRPSSMPATSNQSIASHGGSVLASADQNRSRNAVSAAASAPPDPSHPLSLSSYLVNQPPQNHSPQPPGLRQNHLLHHYPLQPQQPRLGVQLQQRRQQQHQLQQNIESQQQQQQAQQQAQQQLQQGNHQNQPPPQQGRNGRPLFSVLL